MSKKGPGRSGRGFWSFLRITKEPFSEEEKKEWLGNKTTEQDVLKASEAESFDTLFAHWDTERGTSEAEPSTAPHETSEKAKTRRSEPPEWEISEEAEIPEPEVPEQQPSEEAGAWEPEETTSGSGIVAEELRTLEEQVASLESCIVERLKLRIEAASLSSE